MEQGTSQQGPSDEEMRRAVTVLVGHAVHQLEKGSSQSEVEYEFIQRGFTRQVASSIVQRAVEVRLGEHQAPESFEQAEQRRIHAQHQGDPIFARMQAGQKSADGHADMILGGLICLVGIGITAATYSAASGGGTYVVAWGAIIFGAVRFFKGLAA